MFESFLLGMFVTLLFISMRRDRKEPVQDNLQGGKKKAQSRKPPPPPPPPPRRS